MERDFEKLNRLHQSRIVLNDYPSSHMPPSKRPKFWGDAFEPPTAQRTLSYVERPCTPREITATHRLDSTQKHAGAPPPTQPRWSGADKKCRLDSDGSGVSAAHCGPCYASSTYSAGDRPRTATSAAAVPADRAAELMLLSSLVEKQIESASLMGCGSIVKPTATTTKPVNTTCTGASIHMGQGGHVPPILGLGDIITNVPLNISRVISATFYPCNIFLIS